MANTTEVNISEQIRFFGALMGTTGLSEENNNIANNYTNRLLIALDPFVEDYCKEAKEVFQELKGKIVAPSTNDKKILKLDK